MQRKVCITAKNKHLQMLCLLCVLYIHKSEIVKIKYYFLFSSAVIFTDL